MADTKQFEHLKIQLEAITSATNNFADDSCIGGGGFGKVYKAEIVHSKGQSVVAIKRLDRKFGQGDPEFWKEIMLLSLYSHQNIVSLLGYCDDSGEKILAYEYASKRSLDHYLDSMELSWVQRLKICIGAARGLEYLHTPDGETKLRVLHRDIKSANILLDDDLNAKIADFGLSKFAPANNQFSYLVTNAAGTFGYCDPLYFETNLLTKESDVYSLGVVLFEVLCGRLCLGNTVKNPRPLIELVQECYGDKRINEIIFGKIKDEIKPNSLDKFLSIAHQCLNKDRKKRPAMTQIVKELESALESQSLKAYGGTQIFGILTVKILTATGFSFSDDFRVTFRTSNRDYISVHEFWSKYGKMTQKSCEKFSLYLNEPVNDTKLQIMVHKHVETSSDKKRIYGYEGMYERELGDLTPKVSKILSASIGKGSIKVEVIHKPFPYYTILEDVCPLKKLVGTPKGRGRLVVIIHEGIGFKGKSHTYTYARFVVTNTINGETSPICDTCNPMWEETFKFDIEAKEVKGLLLHLTVISVPRKGLTSILKEEEVLGEVNIRVSDIIYQKWINKSYALSKRSGWVQVELQWISSDWVMEEGKLPEVIDGGHERARIP